MTELPTPPADDSSHLGQVDGSTPVGSAEKADRVNDGLVNEQTAAQAAGVSVATLQRFVEVGALNAVEKEGGVFYLIPHIERLFSVTIHQPRTPLRTISLPTSPLARSAVAPTESTLESRETEVERQLLTAPPASTTPSKATLGEDEVNMFKQVLDAQDKLLALKDAEIADLKSQRAWLQQRVEKLEQQSDRDRLILLSEAHTIKQLVAIEANRKSKIRAALEFFGIVPLREPVPAPPPLSWEVATTERLSSSVAAPLSTAAVPDGRPLIPEQAEELQKETSSESAKARASAG